MAYIIINLKIKIHEPTYLRDRARIDSVIFAEKNTLDQQMPGGTTVEITRRKED